MLVKAFPSGPFLTNAYVVACKQTKKAAIIDPSLGSFEPIRNFLNTNCLSCDTILLTHSHWDHIANVKKFKDHYSIPVYVHPLDAPNLIHPGADLLPGMIEIEGVEPDEMLEEGMEYLLGSLCMRVLHTPGHSPGSVCFYEASQGVLLSGDTLFKGSMGNVSFPTSEPEKMWSSLKRLNELPKDTLVYPGHGPATTIKEEAIWLSKPKELFS